MIEIVSVFSSSIVLSWSFILVRLHSNLNLFCIKIISVRLCSFNFIVCVIWNTRMKRLLECCYGRDNYIGRRNKTNAIFYHQNECNDRSFQRRNEIHLTAYARRQCAMSSSSQNDFKMNEWRENMQEITATRNEKKWMRLSGPESDRFWRLRTTTVLFCCDQLVIHEMTSSTFDPNAIDVDIERTKYTSYYYMSPREMIHSCLHTNNLFHFW